MQSIRLKFKYSQSKKYHGGLVTTKHYRKWFVKWENFDWLFKHEQSHSCRPRVKSDYCWARHFNFKPQRRTYFARPLFELCAITFFQWYFASRSHSWGLIMFRIFFKRILQGKWGHSKDKLFHRRWITNSKWWLNFFIKDTIWGRFGGFSFWNKLSFRGTVWSCPLSFTEAWGRKNQVSLRN